MSATLSTFLGSLDGRGVGQVQIRSPAVQASFSWTVPGVGSRLSPALEGECPHGWLQSPHAAPPVIIHFLDQGRVDKATSLTLPMDAEGA